MTSNLIKLMKRTKQQELKIIFYFDEFHKIKMELQSAEEICNYLSDKMINAKIQMKTYLYNDWMTKLDVKIVGNDEELKKIIGDIFIKNQHKPLKFFSNIAQKFIESLPEELILGKCDMFKTYLLEVQNKLYEEVCSNDQITTISDDTVEKSLQDLIEILSDSSDEDINCPGANSTGKD